LLGHSKMPLGLKKLGLQPGYNRLRKL